MNTIYEDCWDENDHELYYDQLVKAADYIIDNEIYKNKYISLFDINMRFSNTYNDKKKLVWKRI